MRSNLGLPKISIPYLKNLEITDSQKVLDSVLGFFWRNRNELLKKMLIRKTYEIYIFFKENLK